MSSVRDDWPSTRQNLRPKSIIKFKPHLDQNTMVEMTTTVVSKDDKLAKHRTPVDENIRRQKFARKVARKKLLKEGKWDQCMHMIEKKKRYCSFERMHGSLYCGNHRSEHESTYQRTRVPCPIDPSHTVYSEDLAHHVKICNKLQYLQNLHSASFYSNGINSNHSTVPTAMSRSTTEIDEIDLHSFRSHIHLKYHELFQDCPIPFQRLHHPAMDALVESKVQQGASLGATIRHINQQASIIGHMDQVHMLHHPEQKIWIEFGAGKGKLSLVLNEILSSEPSEEEQAQPTKNYSDNFYLIDRGNARGKADVGSRIRIDIRDLRLSGLSPFQFDSRDGKEAPSRPKHPSVIALSKHLCGAATDLTLRCLETLDPVSTSTVNGIAIALCCHHACTFEDYIDHDFLEKELGLQSKAEFQLMVKWTSWGTCGKSVQSVASEDPQLPHGVVTHEDRCHFSPQERETLGLECKRLIDLGRKSYIEKKFGLRAQLIYYCTKEESLENCLLLAHRPE